MSQRTAIESFEQLDPNVPICKQHYNPGKWVERCDFTSRLNVVPAETLKAASQADWQPAPVEHAKEHCKGVVTYETDNTPLVRAALEGLQIKYQKSPEDDKVYVCGAQDLQCLEHLGAKLPKFDEYSFYHNLKQGALYR